VEYGLWPEWWISVARKSRHSPDTARYGRKHGISLPKQFMFESKQFYFAPKQLIFGS
jgi:hypothetical protein